MKYILLLITLNFSCFHTANDEHKDVVGFIKDKSTIQSIVDEVSVNTYGNRNKLTIGLIYSNINVDWAYIVGFLTAYEISLSQYEALLIKSQNKIQESYIIELGFKEDSLLFEVPVPDDYSALSDMPVRHEFSKIVAQQMSPLDISAYDSLFLVLHQETKKDFFSQNFDRFFTTVTTNEYLDNNEEEILDSLISRSDKIPSVSSKGLRIFKNNLEELIILDEGEQ